jgi:flagellar L-ring protein precursor FlgH
MRRCIVQLILVIAVLPLHAESLWRSETLSDGTLYSDQVARRKGDLITILVVETTSVSDTQRTEKSRENDISASVNMVPLTTATPSSIGASSVGHLPALDLESNREFEGIGEYRAEGSVRAVITGRVMDVLDNGNLVVEGRRSVQVNEDTKVILITGIARTADVLSDNTVRSEKLHNFQVAIEGEGPLTRSQQEGWLGRIFDVIWPF